MRQSSSSSDASPPRRRQASPEFSPPLARCVLLQQPSQQCYVQREGMHWPAGAVCWFDHLHCITSHFVCRHTSHAELTQAYSLSKMLLNLQGQPSGQA